MSIKRGAAESKDLLDTWLDSGRSFDSTALHSLRSLRSVPLRMTVSIVAAKEMEFERAADLRDEIKALEDVLATTK